MRLTAMACAFREQLKNPAVSSLSFEDRLGFLTDIEWSSRKNNRLNNMPGYQKFLYGPVVLGVDVKHEILINESDEFKPLGMGRFFDVNNDEILEPANDLTLLYEEEAKTFAGRFYS